MLSVEYVLKFRLATRTQGSVFKLCFIERLPHPMATGSSYFEWLQLKHRCAIYIFTTDYFFISKYAL